MTLLGLFLLFAKIACLTFGGGYAMIPLFQYEIVTRHAFMSAADFANLVAVAQVTPGPIGFNSATFVGMVHGGLSGAVAASLGVMVPSILIALVVAVFLAKTGQARWMKTLMKGVRPCVAGIVASAVIFFADTSVLQGGFCWQGAAAFVFVLVVRWLRPKMNPVWPLLASGVLCALLFLV